jgi:peptidoglycan/xylan/chitin deacetylase (PgdA/CDA1 family)
MSNPRYDFLTLFNAKRKKIKWPNNARVALWVGPNIEYFHMDMPFRGAKRMSVRDYVSRDYGSRIGVFRMMEVLDKHGMSASVLLNSDVCVYQPEIIEEGKKRKWEWLGHGMTNSKRMTDYPLEEERKAIKEVKEMITKSTGAAPRGWLGPSWDETEHTLDLLAAEGFTYICDWSSDDQPFPMRVKSGKMIGLPYRGVNDLPVFLDSSFTPRQYLEMLCDEFDTLYREGAEGGRIMTIGLHPYLIGVPHRIQYLDKALEYILAHEGVWKTTAGEIAEWYYKHYYEDPGPLK